MGRERRCIKDFLSLPKKLYSADKNMESADTVRKILLGRHPLSGYFSLEAYVIYDRREPVGRFAITEYPEDDTAYIGFFECVEKIEVAAFLFRKAEEICRKKEYSRMIGPVDASFWIKYRLKINHFDLPPYTGEPYNREYYYDYFLENGFHVKEHYTSNGYRAIDESYVNPKYERRYRTFSEKGYRIESPTAESYGKAMEEVYSLLTSLYSGFPIYKPIAREDFRAMFRSYQSIMNLSMTKMAYLGDRTVGFLISLPDYGNLVYHLNPVNLLKVIRLRKNPGRYVMLYMGVDHAHKGLGTAMVHDIMRELKESHLPSIGALARDGKVTQSYASDVITDVYEYVLLERILK